MTFFLLQDLLTIFSTVLAHNERQWGPKQHWNPLTLILLCSTEILQVWNGIK